ncbi:MAG: SRPBCC family protein [Actinomycetota bacterium]|nr:SRPBCC family protein [Actinomycetota bacterium]
MSQQGPASAEASIDIDADPAAVYALITDLPTLASLAEETQAMAWSKGESVAPGAVFKGQNRNGAKTWTTACTVTDAQPGRTFAFDVRSLAVPVAHWRYDIVAGERGCTVTERTWDKRPGWFRKPASMATGVKDRDAANAAHIRVTLQRLKEKAESVRTA